MVRAKRSLMLPLGLRNSHLTQSFCLQFKVERNQRSVSDQAQGASPRAFDVGIKSETVTFCLPLACFVELSCCVNALFNYLPCATIAGGSGELQRYSRHSLQVPNIVVGQSDAPSRAAIAAAGIVAPGMPYRSVDKDRAACDPRENDCDDIPWLERLRLHPARASNGNNASLSRWLDSNLVVQSLVQSS